jgi:hypothetical protein
VQQAAKDDGYGVGKMYNSISNQTRWHLTLETTFPFVYNIELECALPPYTHPCSPHLADHLPLCL